MIKLCEVFRVTSKWRKMSAFPIISFLRKSVFVPMNFYGKNVMKLSWKYFLSSISIALFTGGFVFGLIKIAAAYGPWSYVHPIKQECDQGYYGNDCLQCPYPSYGDQCKGKCECKPNLCHFKTGCPTLGTKCPLGYVGRYCDKPCQFPYYGVACQQTCACSSKQCNFTSGCLSINANNINIISQKKTVITATQYTGIKEKQTELGKSDYFDRDKGFSEEPQSHFLTENDTIKENTIKVLAGKSFPNQRLQNNENRWSKIIFVSLGVLVAVLVIAHVLLSINNCIKGKKRPTNV